jgi:hypothetical protein
MQASATMLDRIGGWIAAYLSRPIRGFVPLATYSAAQLRAALQPGDVLLVEGNLRISTAIKYLTQSTWSHAALYVGPRPGRASSDDPPVLIEAEVGHGVILSPLSKYADFHTRICRASGLRGEDRDRIVAFALSQLGHSYDLKNVFDLARYLLRTPPVPTPWRRRMLALGSGEPTQAICSTLIAQAFQSIGYPILPSRLLVPCHEPPPDRVEDCVEPVLQTRHFSLFAPRDFDVSPYFTIVKPPPAEDFDYTQLRWAA